MLTAALLQVSAICLHFQSTCLFTKIVYIFFSEHSPTNSETNDITLTEEELLLKRFEHNEGIDIHCRN